VHLTALQNALAEAFFASLKTELLQQHTFATRKAARLALFDYMEGFYNSHRRHSALGYLSPAEFERRASQRQKMLRRRGRDEMLSEAGG
jgi:putative transposase